MFKAMVVATLILASGVASAQVQVQGYVRRDGTYVQPYTRSAPNATRSDNYGSSRSTRNISSYQPSYVSPYNRDQDADGISNQYDSDDDNDGTLDDYEPR